MIQAILAPRSLPSLHQPLAPARPLPVRPLPVLPTFSKDLLSLSRAQETGLNGPNLLAGLGDPGKSAFAVERAKIEHESPDMTALPDFTVTPMRIGLEVNQTKARFGITAGALYVEGPEGRKQLLADASGDFEAEAIEGGFVLKQGGQSLGRFEGRLIVDNTSPTMLINGQVFRGDLELMPSPANPKTFQVINPVLLEDYLLSVVPSESPASWPLESLKAQSLAARTYAVANWGKRKAEGFDMSDDTSDQMYRGVVTEAPGPNEAVKATAHQVITHQGKPINALFFSCSGGMTDSAKEVWGMDLPYIQPVPDFDQAAPRYRWNVTKSQADLQAAAKKLGVDVGIVKSVTPLTLTPQGRVQSLRINGTTGSAEVDGNKFRFAAGLNSTFWKASPSGNGNARSISFDGGGWGHGLGMSQYGARQMAADGKDAEAIIKHYYQGVAIESLK